MKTIYVGSIAAAAIALQIAAAQAAPAPSPTVVQNVDEPGRNPYQDSQTFNHTTQFGCTQFVCTLKFKPVPAGQRLVVTYASAAYSLAPNGTEASVALAIDGDFTSSDAPQQFILTVPIGGSRVVGAGPTVFYVEAGHQPSLLLAGNTLATGLTAQATVAGYLVSVP